MATVDCAPFRAAVAKHHQSGKLPDGSAMHRPKGTYEAAQALK